MVHAFNKDQDTLASLLKIIEELGHFKDLDALLDKVLLEARRLINADAGSIFLVEGQVLKFSYIHNDSLFNFPSNKYLYTQRSIGN